MKNPVLKELKGQLAPAFKSKAAFRCFAVRLLSFDERRNAVMIVTDPQKE